MKIGIAYDTPEMYDLKSDRIYYDFAEQISIIELQKIIQKSGHTVNLVGNAKNIIKLIKQDDFEYDLIYNTVEGLGSRNREGLVPAILEANNIPFIGTDAFGISLTLNKRLTKVLAQNIGILTPKYHYISVYDSKNSILRGLEKLHMPVIIKPNYEGNSSGICVKETIYDATNAIGELIKKYNSDILCEEFIKGKEVTVATIGNYNDIIMAATTVDIQTKDDFWLDINCKIFGDYKNIPLEDEKNNRMLYTICKKLIKTIGCKDFARFDFRISNNNKIYFIEANPLPALFRGGSFDILGQKYGLKYEETIQLIIDTARRRIGI